MRSSNFLALTLRQGLIDLDACSHKLPRRGGTSSRRSTTDWILRFAVATTTVGTFTPSQIDGVFHCLSPLSVQVLSTSGVVAMSYNRNLHNYPRGQSCPRRITTDLILRFGFSTTTVGTFAFNELLHLREEVRANRSVMDVPSFGRRYPCCVFCTTALIC